MQTSARNQFLGKVVSVKSGPVNAEVILDIGGGDQLVAVITHDSVEHLGLKAGVEAYALIKAPWVIVTRADSNLKISARNKLCGTVDELIEGAVNSEVIIGINEGKRIAAIVTNESAKGLDLKKGTAVCAHIKASHIILAVEA